MIIQVCVNVKTMKKPLNERFQELAGIKLLKEGYDGVIQRYLDQIIDDVTGPDITKEEAIEYIDELSQAILSLKTTTISDIFNN